MTDNDDNLHQTGTEPSEDIDSGADTGKVAGLRRARPCPNCSKPSVKDSYPFCSARCKDVDLSRWLKGAYAIPAVEQDDPDEDDYGDFS